MSTYALSTALVAHLPVEQALRAFAEAGFSEAEISGNDEAMDRWLSDLPRLRGLLDCYGIAPRSVHIPAKGWDNASPDEPTRLASVAAAQVAMAQAAELGAEMVICHANKPSEPITEETYKASAARSRKSLQTLASDAERLGIKIALENLPARGTPRPTAKMTQVLELIAGLGTHMGVCLDAGHSNANGISPAVEVRQAGEKLLALHIQDNDGLGEDQHLLPGQGTTDWEAFLAALDQVRFAGLRTFESMKGMEAAEMLSALSALSQLWSHNHS